MIHPVVIDMHIPAGMLGPDPVDMDVRCFVVPHGSGVVLVDTGVEPDPGRIEAGLAAAGAAWADVSDVVLTHNHPDHVGGLAEVRRRARQATVWGGADEYDGPVSMVEDGDRVRELRALTAPGHTPGHLCLLDEDSGALLVGDAVGNVGGTVARAPTMFTADAETAERSLHRIAEAGPERMVFSHGAEVADPLAGLRSLLDQAR